MKTGIFQDDDAKKGLIALLIIALAAFAATATSGGHKLEHISSLFMANHLVS